MKFIFALLFLWISTQSQTTYRFVVFGDRYGNYKAGTFEKLRDQALQLQPAPAFFISTGDFISGGTTDTLQLIKDWEDRETLLKPIKSKYSWYQVPGWHDVSYNVSEPFYKRYAGDLYYFFDIGEDRFIVLNTSQFDAPSQMDSTQLNFLKSTLAKSKTKRYLFCLYFSPFWRTTPNEGIMDSIHDLFKAAGVDYVINGEYHSYIHAKRDNINYIVTGSSGGSSDNKKINGTTFQYGLVDVSPTSISYRPITIDGDTQSTYWITDTILLQKKSIQTSISSKPICLKWQDTSTPPGIFEVSVTNSTNSQISGLLSWDPIPNSPENRWNISPVNTATETIQTGMSKTFKFNYSIEGIWPGPRICLSVPFMGDTVRAMHKITVNKELLIRKRKEAVRIDGLLSEKIWVTSGKDSRHFFGNKTEYYDSTWIAFQYDNDFLYGAFIAYDPSPDSLVVITKPDVRDSCSGVEDIIIYSLIPNHDTTTIYSLLLSSANACRDEKITVSKKLNKIDPSWDGIVEHKTIKTVTGWQGEFKVPWKSLVSTNKTSLSFNCKRASKRIKKRSPNISFQVPLNTFSEMKFE